MDYDVRNPQHGSQIQGLKHTHIASVFHHDTNLFTRSAILLAVLLLAAGVATVAHALYDKSHDTPLLTKAAAESRHTAGAPNAHEDQQDKQSASSSSSTNNNGNASNHSSTTVSVNGQSVDVPANGSYSKTIDTPNGQTTVSGENSQSSSTSGNSASNSSSTNVNVHSQ